MTKRGGLLLLSLAVVACAAQNSFTRVEITEREAIVQTISDPGTLP